MTTSTFSFGFLFALLIHAVIVSTTPQLTTATGLSSSPEKLVTMPQRRSILVTGSNKGQGYALCERILSEHDDTHVFLCSRDVTKGQSAFAKLSSRFGSHRVDLVSLDVTDDHSIRCASQQVRERLLEGNNNQNSKNGDDICDYYLYGVVSNAGILWGHSLGELFDVCTTGVKRVLDEFVELLHPTNGRIIVVSSGLGPLMNGYSSHREALMAGSDWTVLQTLMEECLRAYNNNITNNNNDKSNNNKENNSNTAEEQTTNEKEENESESESEFSKIGFPGGPFETQVSEFHHYGLSKMFADAYMLTLHKRHPRLHIYSCDPGLVYTDLIGKMPRYTGMSLEETGAKTPHQGVEVVMRLLFPKQDDDDDDDTEPPASSGKFYAMSKDGTELLSSNIDKMPNK